MSHLKIIENRIDSEEFKDVLFGTLDTWINWTISREKLYSTEITCAAATGLYDMFHVIF